MERGTPLRKWQISHNTRPNSDVKTHGHSSSIAQGTQIPNLPEIRPLAQARISVGYDEMDRVLGGGLVAGSLTLIGGEPGIGKSTLLLQVAGNVAKSWGSAVHFR